MSQLFPAMFTLPNLHPLFVHFPIAFWLLALVLACVGVWRAQSSSFRFAGWLLHVGTMSGAVAVVSGYLAAAPMDHEAPGHEIVHVHRNLMLAAAAASLVASVAWLALRKNACVRNRLMQLGCVGAVVALASLGADRGALLVYRHGVGVSAEPSDSAAEHGHDGSHEHEHR